MEEPADEEVYEEPADAEAHGDMEDLTDGE